METEKSRLEQFKEFVELDPTDTFSRYALGMEYMGAGDYRQALEQFDEVIRLDSGDSPAYFQAGNACEILNENDRAKEYLEKGIQAAEKKGDKHAKEEMTAALDRIKDQG
jgi:tetratricopeptide (TPR) repeat protein